SPMGSGFRVQGSEKDSPGPEPYLFFAGLRSRRLPAKKNSAGLVDSDGLDPSQGWVVQALATKIQGAVWLACLVTNDGTVSGIVLLRSLDSGLGLDREAILAARQWRFSATTLRGRPVPVLVMIELTFTVRR